MHTPLSTSAPLLSIALATALHLPAAWAGRSDFRYDFPEFQVATAEYEVGPTGMTLFYFPNGATTAIDVRGGSAATRESTLLESKSAYPAVDAIVLAGGSTYGLESASGVMASLLARRGNSVKFVDIPSVPAAVVYDFGGRENAIYPDVELGKRAFSALRTNEVSLGEAGAGRNVSVGKYFGRAFAEKSGQGAAFTKLAGLKIFGLTVVNSMGTVVDFAGNVLLGNFDAATGRRRSIPEQILGAGGAALASPTTKGNTTISIVVTNAKLSHAELERVGVMAHTAMGRVIEPFHSPSDGDVLFTATTGTFALPASDGPEHVGTLAGRTMQNAVLNAVARVRGTPPSPTR